MIFKKKLICLLFLFAFGIVLTHNIIPHHHHFDDFLENHPCHAQQNDTHHHSHFPAHCHAFNETSFIKNTLSTYPIIVKVIAVLDPILTDKSVLLSIEEQKVQYCETDDNVPDIFHSSPHARRAPPLFS